MTLHFVEHPLWKDAHPGDVNKLGEDARCPRCAVAENEEGERFMLWLSNDVHWTLSRHDPRAGTDVGEIDLEGI